MATFEKIVSLKSVPTNKYVLWLDTSVNPPVLKSYIQGKGWVAANKDEEEDTDISTLKGDVKDLDTEVKSIKLNYVTKETYNTKGIYVNIDLPVTKPIGSLTITSTDVTKYKDSDTYEYVMLDLAPDTYNNMYIKSCALVLPSALIAAVADIDWSSQNSVTYTNGDFKIIVSHFDDDPEYTVDYDFNDGVHYYNGVTTSITAESASAIECIFYDGNERVANNLIPITATDNIGPAGVFAFKPVFEYEEENTKVDFISFKSEESEFLDTLENIKEYKTKLADLETRVAALEEE